MHTFILAVLLAVSSFFSWTFNTLDGGYRLCNVAESSLNYTVVITETVEVTDFFGETRLASVAGSGVVISTDGYILTAAHMVDGIKVKAIFIEFWDGVVVAGELVKVDDRDDLALMKVFFPTPYAAAIADPRKVRVGQEILVIGNPLRVAFTVTQGIISGLNRDYTGYNMVQCDAPINPGNSGGPMFNLRGDVAGIIVNVIPPVNAPIWTGLGFAVSSAQVIEFLTDCKVKYRMR